MTRILILSAQLDDELRGRLRENLMSGIPWVLSQDDYSGNLKAIVATTLRESWRAGRHRSTLAN